MEFAILLATVILFFGLIFVGAEISSLTKAVYRLTEIRDRDK